MVRTDGDSWDIVSSVGLTALWVAMFRALETAADPSSLNNTPFFPGFMGVRTKFYDEFFLSAAAAGASGAVLLAAGLDALPYRLDWPSGTTVFEVDQPKVLEFKQEVLDQHGASTKTERRSVSVDLRDDWPAALEAEGFDPVKPTAWSAEGLLPYLPGIAHDLLFERIDALSVRGSHLAVDNFVAGADTQRFATITSKYFGQSVFGDIDVSALLFDDERAEPAQCLTEHGWSVTRVNPFELAVVFGRPVEELPAELATMMNQAMYVTAVK
ncbi:SAM-dependent methyltransferase [Rhodococcus sp. IEGM 1379]|uniref:SAM-dependent methyltransferase n=1 Tax=Rhodococcus sp. IEGM 1379 TaxID=3047086 RepID=UPI0024B79CD1|nr:SAM-dependent methyltransferase [Rhodococcus sp. IEGM 1379]MDI9917420.1 SAM-dependent methyltransferase [Rhodococcus sp. IEGM 1379]